MKALFTRVINKHIKHSDIINILCGGVNKAVYIPPETNRKWCCHLIQPNRKWTWFWRIRPRLTSDDCDEIHLIHTCLFWTWQALLRSNLWACTSAHLGVHVGPPGRARLDQFLINRVGHRWFGQNRKTKKIKPFSKTTWTLTQRSGTRTSADSSCSHWPPTFIFTSF